MRWWHHFFACMFRCASNIASCKKVHTDAAARKQLFIANLTKKMEEYELTVLDLYKDALKKLQIIPSRCFYK